MNRLSHDVAQWVVDTATRAARNGAAAARAFKGTGTKHAPAEAKQIDRAFAAKTVLATWQDPAGAVRTELVSLCGIWRVSDIEEQVSRALKTQRGAVDPQVLNISMHFGKCGAGLQALNDGETYLRKAQFDAECG